MPLMKFARLSLLLLIASCTAEPPPPAAPPPTKVGVVTLQAESVALTTELVGRTTPYLMSEVRPQVTGIVKQRLFEEGTLVKAGDVLYQIEPAPFQATVNEAQAALTNAQATVVAARLKSERYADLVKIEAVARQDADDAQATYRQSVANVAQQKAALESAQIQLRFTRITAPISGRIGRSTVTAGALVSANQTDALATIRALDPMYVDMNQSSASLLRLKRMLGSGQVDPGATAVSLRLEDGSIYSHAGEMKFAEVAVDQETGSVTLRATFPNPDEVLLPGMYVQSIVNEAIEPRGILAPQQGIARDAKGNAVALVVDAENKVVQRAVETTRAIGNAWLIAKGLAAGDRLIVEGVEKTRVGAVVEPLDVSKTFAGARPATQADGTPAASASGDRPGAGATAAPATAQTAAPAAASATSAPAGKN